MDKNDEIKKDLEALNEYLKKGNPDDLSKFAEIFGKKNDIPPAMIKKSIEDETKFKVDYYDTIKNQFGIKSTPARVNRTSGIIEVDKKHFMPEKGTLEYHRLQINMFNLMTMFEAQHIEGNIIHKVNITNKRILEWFDYLEGQLKQYNESIRFVNELNLGKEIKKDYMAVGIVAKVKYLVITKFWWRMGWLGIKQRIKLIKLDRSIKKFKNKHKDIFKDGKIT